MPILPPRKATPRGARNSWAHTRLARVARPAHLRHPASSLRGQRDPRLAKVSKREERRKKRETHARESEELTISPKRRYPSTLGIDFRKLGPEALRTYVNRYRLDAAPDAPDSELAKVVAKHLSLIHI